MAKRNDELDDAKLLEIGKREVREYKRGKSYYVRWRCLYRFPDGQEKWHWTPSRAVHGRKSEAEAEAERYRQELEARIGKTNRVTTVGEFARAFHDERKRSGEVSTLTIERDEADIKRIVRYFGDIPITELDTAEIRRKLATMTDDGVSEYSQYKTKIKLKQIMRQAYMERIIDRNPCDGIVNRSPAPDAEKKAERRIATKDAVRFANELLSEDRTGKIVAIWLALATGLRRGEVLALSWSDIDLHAKKLHVRFQYGKERRLKETKTAKSKRTIALDASTVDYLGAWKGEQGKQLKAQGIEQSADTPVCSNETGERLDPDDFSRFRRSYFVKHGLAYWKNEKEWTDSRGIQRVRRSGYVGPNLHSLRHVQATLLVAAGVDPKTVQARLGHSRISTTLEIYAEAEEANDVEAADYIGRLLGGASGE